MSEVERLYNNIKMLIECKTLDHEFEVFAKEHKYITSISVLNDIIEESVSYYKD